MTPGPRRPPARAPRATTTRSSSSPTATGRRTTACRSRRARASWCPPPRRTAPSACACSSRSSACPRSTRSTRPRRRTCSLRMTGASDLPGEVVGVGIEDAPVATPGEIRKRLDLLGDFVVYVGRIEREKGCARLFDEFARFVQERDAAPQPRADRPPGAAGPAAREHHAPGRRLGRGEAVGDRRVAGARASQSRFESLSMALLEAWKMERPALVNAKCAVLRGQVQRGERRALLRRLRGVRGDAVLAARAPGARRTRWAAAAAPTSSGTTPGTW